MNSHILIITTNHEVLDGKPNGTYFPELTHALDSMTSSGISWDIASPKGGEIPGYGADADDVTKRWLAIPDFAESLRNTTPLADVNVDAYDGVFYPGGYGLLFDLVENEHSHKITTSLYEKGKPIAAVCHAPAALSEIKLSDGSWLIDGKHVTGFTREEEVAMETLDVIPFLLEERMIERGAIYRKRANWKELVVKDGLLITGQNPGSATAVGKALVAALG